jgi:hypothetical protein
MTSEELIKKYPALYHMAESGTWQSIKEYGLLSTVALAELFSLSDSEKQKLIHERRPDSVVIEHPKHGKATVRDNKVLHEHLLEKCLLDDLSPADWYEILNKRVFFWPTENRLLGLLTARPYRNKAHCVLAVNTAKLVARYKEKISLSRINSGSTIYNPAKRGLSTFRRIPSYEDISIAELAVDHAVPDIRDLVVWVREMRGDVTKEVGVIKKRTTVLECLV